MGVGLSCLGESKSSSTQEKLTSKPASSEDGTSGSSFFSFFKPGGGCFCAQEDGRGRRFHSSSVKHHPHPQAQEMNKKDQKVLRSLGDWLSESTSSTSGTSVESCIFMSFSKKVHPSSVHPRRDSFSTEKLLKDYQEVDIGEDLHVAAASSFSGSLSQSQKAGKAKKKKVSFRLLEDNEIIIFSSPAAFEEEDQ